MNTAQTTKNLAQKIAKQIAQEPFEILKESKEQITGTEVPGEKEISENKQKFDMAKEELNDKAKSSRRMEAYQRELTDIQKDELFKDLQRRIAQGGEIPIGDYPGLSLEQKQVLKAQMEAVKNRGLQNVADIPLAQPAAKRGRRLFNFGRKQEVKRQQQRVENIVPPSG